MMNATGKPSSRTGNHGPAALMAFAGAAFLAASALADGASVTITGVTQRWPWNNKLDIAYTVSGGQTRASGVYCGIRFAFTANGQTYSIEGSSIGASAENGSNVATWTAPQGIVTTDGSMTATLYSTNVPSGDDYMVVDLASGNVAYEGLFATQEDSNARYNTAEYKTDKLVLRKVAAGGPYPTGDSTYYSSGNDANSSTTWTTDRDYYIGVFPVTQKQYKTIYGSNPSLRQSAQSGHDNNIPEHRPVEQVSWNSLRVAATAPDSPIPAVSSFSGTFFQRLNFRTGLYFDLPTEVMFEIAERAGTTTHYFWGNSAADGDAYAIHKNSTDASGGNMEMAVGSRLPNGWGLYDMAGNVREWCLDDDAAGDLANRADAFTPSSVSGTKRRTHGWGAWSETLTDTSKPNENARFRSSYRGSMDPSTSNNSMTGFRVSLIAD